MSQKFCPECGKEIRTVDVHSVCVQTVCMNEIQEDGTTMDYHALEIGDTVNVTSNECGHDVTALFPKL